MNYWVLINGDPDVCGVIYWCGYDARMKDHTWDRDKSKAVRFAREIDATRAGVGCKPAGVLPVAQLGD